MTDDARTSLKLKEAMAAIVGCQLSSVTFVQDYVQLAFDGAGLTAYTHPTISLGSQSLHWGEAGYRDALWEQIGRRIQQVEVNEQHVVVHFEGNAAVSVSLLDEDYTGPEALAFSLNRRQELWVI